MQNKLLVHLQLSLEGKGCSWNKNFKFYLTVKGFNSLHAGRFLCLLSSAYFFFKIFYFEKRHFGKTIRVPNSSDPDQARHFVRPELGPICFVKAISR